MNRPAPEEVLDFVVSFVSEHGYAPTVQEIGRAFDVASTSVIASTLDEPHDDGLNQRATGIACGIDVVGHSDRRGDERGVGGAAGVAACREVGISPAQV